MNVLRNWEYSSLKCRVGMRLSITCSRISAAVSSNQHVDRAQRVLNAQCGEETRNETLGFALAFRPPQPETPKFQTWNARLFKELLLSFPRFVFSSLVLRSSSEIPQFRPPRAAVQFEVDLMKDLGVKVMKATSPQILFSVAPRTPACPFWSREAQGSRRGSVVQMSAALIKNN